MTLNAWIQLGVFLVVLLVLARPLGRFMANVLAGESRVNRWFAPVERGLYRLCGIDPEKEMHWRAYAIALIGFNAVGRLPSTRCNAGKSGCRSTRRRSARSPPIRR